VSDRISVGIAGWSYPDWDGYVYPARVKDKLRYIAPYVDMIEINSTFYRPPTAKTVDSWVRRTDDLPGFYFTAKIHQDVTHGGIVAPAMMKAFRDGFGPMAEAKRLRHLLAQFRYDFDDTPLHRGHLARIRDGFGGITNLTLELRHVSWQVPEALAFLSSLGVNLTTLDYPLTGNSFRMRLSPVGDHAYLRLHGRNSEAWFSRSAGRDQTYNYCYSTEELDEITDRAVEQAGMSKSLTLVANNHYQGKEVVNAMQVKAMLLGERIRIPPGLAEKYPQLKKYQASDDNGKKPRPHTKQPPAPRWREQELL